MATTQIQLTTKNAHRAAVVENINHPEWGTFAFRYQSEELGPRRYADSVGSGSHSKIVHQNEYQEWRIVSYKHPVLLEEFDSLASRAFNWVSFDPERRGVRTVMNAETELNKDLKDMPEEEKERYIQNYKKHFSAWLTACSNCASSVITGGSNFNVRRAEAANNRESARLKEFAEWREKALKAIARRVQEAKPQEQKIEEAWKSIKNDIDRHFLPANLYNRLETIARKGEVELMQRAIDYVRELNQKRPRPIFTERHKFFKLAEVANSVRQQQADMSEKDNCDIPFAGGVVRLNYAEDRLQILFDEKPAADMISKLKSSGFRWSPRFGAWQRQLTGNAIYAAQRLLNVEVK
ncbi:hypothetical protein [uncultured Alistipes sp.]|jgi:hypothetical protein|uniref:hypothetical protein n=1 Tax=uncultured Alistipes sp. TaxID=538949 RepID=UPI0025F15A36|nr:hypothetical protein [uncultured Alistipes sp.]